MMDPHLNLTDRYVIKGFVREKGLYGDVQPTKFIYESFLIEPDKDGNPDPRLDTTLFHPNSTENFIGEPYSWWEAQFRKEINTAF